MRVAFSLADGVQSTSGSLYHSYERLLTCARKTKGWHIMNIFDHYRQRYEAKDEEFTLQDFLPFVGKIAVRLFQRGRAANGHRRA